MTPKAKERSVQDPLKVTGKQFTAAHICPLATFPEGGSLLTWENQAFLLPQWPMKQCDRGMVLVACLGQ